MFINNSKYDWDSMDVNIDSLEKLDTIYPDAEHLSEAFKWSAHPWGDEYWNSLYEHIKKKKFNDNESRKEIRNMISEYKLDLEISEMKNNNVISSSENNFVKIDVAPRVYTFEEIPEDITISVFNMDFTDLINSNSMKKNNTIYINAETSDEKIITDPQNFIYMISPKIIKEKDFTYYMNISDEFEMLSMTRGFIYKVPSNLKGTEQGEEERYKEILYLRDFLNNYYGDHQLEKESVV